MLERLKSIQARPQYVPMGALRMLFESKAPEVCVSGPAGTGKSRACLERVHAILQAHAGARALVVRKTRESLTESGLFTFEKHVIGDGHPLIGNLTRNHRQHYLYDNGSEMVVGGMDKASKIMSTEYDVIYVQEAIELTENDWESLTTRLRNYRAPVQQLISDTNPDRPTHWLKAREQSGALQMIESRHEDNPRLWRSGAWTREGREYIGKLDALTGARRERLRFGRWVQAEGVVYEFDRAVHLVDRFPVPADWRRVRSIDFGFTNPFVCLWGAIDNDGRLYIYREMYRTRVPPEEAAETVKALTAGEQIEATVADHDAGDRATFLIHGIRTIAATKSIADGIQKVQARLKVQPDGRPRLFVMRDSLAGRDEALVEAKRTTCLVEEFDSYVWPKGVDGKPTKEEPVKDNDHAMDALRYLVMYLERPRQKYGF
jgi:phage terminase large subunit